MCDSVNAHLMGARSRRFKSCRPDQYLLVFARGSWPEVRFWPGTDRAKRRLKADFGRLLGVAWTLLRKRPWSHAGIMGWLRFKIPGLGGTRSVAATHRFRREDRRALRKAYEDAISEFVAASARLYRRAIDQTAPTPEEIQSFAEAEAQFELARARYRNFWWYRE